MCNSALLVLGLLAPPVDAGGYAVIAGGGSARDAALAIARAKEVRPATLEWAAGFPRVERSDDVAGLPPGRFVAVLGYCDLEDEANVVRDAMNLGMMGSKSGSKEIVQTEAVKVVGGRCPTLPPRGTARSRTDRGYAVRDDQPSAHYVIRTSHLGYRSLQARPWCQGVTDVKVTVEVADRVLDRKTVSSCDEAKTSKRVATVEGVVQLGARSALLVSQVTKLQSQSYARISLWALACGQLRQVAELPRCLVQDLRRGEVASCVVRNAPAGEGFEYARTDEDLSKGGDPLEWAADGCTLIHPRKPSRTNPVASDEQAAKRPPAPPIPPETDWGLTASGDLSGWIGAAVSGSKAGNLAYGLRPEIFVESGHRLGLGVYGEVGSIHDTVLGGGVQALLQRDHLAVVAAFGVSRREVAASASLTAIGTTSESRTGLVGGLFLGGRRRKHRINGDSNEDGFHVPPLGLRIDFRADLGPSHERAIVLVFQADLLWPFEFLADGMGALHR